jgi:hypothetical protein
MGTGLIRDSLRRMISGFGHDSDYPGGKRSFLPRRRRRARKSNRNPVNRFKPFHERGFAWARPSSIAVA